MPASLTRAGLSTARQAFLRPGLRQRCHPALTGVNRDRKVHAYVRLPADGSERARHPSTSGRQPGGLSSRRPPPKPVTLQEWLQRAGRLNNVTSAKVSALALQCMQQLAAFPRHTVGAADASAAARALCTTLACSNGVRAKPRLLSDLGKALQAQPHLRRELRRSSDFRKHTSRMFSLAAADRHSFLDPVNASQLATAQIKIGYYSKEFWDGMARQGMRGLPPRQFANVVYAAGKLHSGHSAPLPTADLQRQIWQSVEAGGERLTASMTPQHISTIWWALGVLNLDIPPRALVVLEAAVVRAADDMDSQNVSNIWWAWAALKLPAQGIFWKMEAAVVRVAASMTAQALSNVWWAWATLQLPSGRIQAPLEAALARLVCDVNEQNIANICWAYGTLQLPPDGALPELEDAILRLSEDGPLGAHALSSIWWALAHLRTSEHRIASTLRDALVQRLPELETQAITTVLMSLALLGSPPDAELFKGLMHAAWQQRSGMDMWQCCNVLWACGVLGVLKGGPMDERATGGALSGDVADGTLESAHSAVVEHMARTLLELHDAGEEFPEEAASQIHAVAAVLKLERRLGADAQSFLGMCQQRMQQQAERGWLEEGDPGDTASEGIMGDKHRAVLETLRSLPELSEYKITSEAPVGDNSRRVDILMEGRDVQVAVEVDGPTHFITSSTVRRVRETGKTALRNWRLRGWGYIVLTVPVCDKTSAQLRSRRAGEWLLSGLRAVGAPL